MPKEKLINYIASKEKLTPYKYKIETEPIVVYIGGLEVGDFKLTKEDINRAIDMAKYMAIEKVANRIAEDIASNY